MVGRDGSYQLSTFTTDDGAPVGDFALTVVWPGPRAKTRPKTNRGRTAWTALRRPEEAGRHRPHRRRHRGVGAPRLEAGRKKSRHERPGTGRTSSNDGPAAACRGGGSGHESRLPGAVDAGGACRRLSSLLGKTTGRTPGQTPRSRSRRAPQVEVLAETAALSARSSMPWAKPGSPLRRGGSSALVRRPPTAWRPWACGRCWWKAPGRATRVAPYLAAGLQGVPSPCAAPARSISKRCWTPSPT